jgi:hypothetical protein
LPPGKGVYLLWLSKNQYGLGSRKAFSAGLESPGSTAGKDAHHYKPDRIFKSCLMLLDFAMFFRVSV